MFNVYKYRYLHENQNKQQLAKVEHFKNNIFEIQHFAFLKQKNMCETVAVNPATFN